MIKIKYSGALAEQTGKHEDTADASSVKELLRYIKNTYGTEAYKTAKKSQITVNSKAAASLGGFGTKLGNGDTVGFWPVCGGG